MNKYTVTRTVYLTETVEVEAETKEHAIEIAKTASLQWDSEFLETDFYEAEEE